MNKEQKTFLPLAPEHIQFLHLISRVPMQS